MTIYKGKPQHAYSQKLNRTIQGSLTHLRKVVRRLAAYDLIIIEKYKKRKLLCLTDKGKRVCEYLYSIKYELGEPFV